MQQGTENRNRVRAVEVLKEALPLFAALAVACGCALHVHYGGIASWQAFVGLALVTSAAQAALTWRVEQRCLRLTRGMTGVPGLLTVWAVVRAVAWIGLVAIGLTGFWSFVDAYLAIVLLCGLFDTAFIFASL